MADRPGPPSLERMGQLTVAAWELALREMARDGQALPADARWLVQRIALVSPVTAARCPYVLRVAGPEVAAAVTRSAVQAWAGVTAVAAPASQEPRSEDRPLSDRVSTTTAARRLGLKPHAIRAACRRGRLAAVRDETGEWAIDLAALDDYAWRRNGKRRAG